MRRLEHSDRGFRDEFPCLKLFAEQGSADLKLYQLSRKVYFIYFGLQDTKCDLATSWRSRAINPPVDPQRGNELGKLLVVGQVFLAIDFHSADRQCKVDVADGQYLVNQHRTTIPIHYLYYSAERVVVGFQGVYRGASVSEKKLPLTLLLGQLSVEHFNGDTGCYCRCPATERRNPFPQALCLCACAPIRANDGKIQRPSCKCNREEDRCSGDDGIAIDPFIHTARTKPSIIDIRVLNLPILVGENETLRINRKKSVLRNRCDHALTLRPARKLLFHIDLNSRDGDARIISSNEKNERRDPRNKAASVYEENYSENNYISLSRGAVVL